MARADKVTAAERLDQVAELMSLGLDSTQIAARLGVKRPRASQLMGQLIRMYGGEAH